MISKKRLISVAAAIAISSVNIAADYLPLTSSATDEKWVMFGVTGFHANGADAGGLGGTDAGMFSISDNLQNIASDEGGDELYGEEGAVPTGAAMLDGANVLASVKRVDGVASPVYVRVRIAENTDISYHETDPVRTIYVKKDADDTSALFAFSYKSILEGQNLEFSTTASGTTDDAYRITVNSENTYNNPAIGEYIPAVPASEGSEGAYLTAVSDMVDYDFTSGPQAANPSNSAKYLKVDHKDVAAAGEYIRLYSYDTASGWLLNDSRNVIQQFETLEKGKGYWGYMDLSAARPAGLVLGSASITTDDYVNGGIDEGWNLLAFNADNADIRAATTGLAISVAVNGTVTLADVSGNQTVTASVTTGDNVASARAINHAVKLAKAQGTIPATFNIVAIPLAGASDLALVSDEKFTIFEDVAGTLGSPTTLNGDTPYSATTLEDHTALADLTVATGEGAMSKYGEYALIVKAENTGWAEFDIKCDTDPSEIVAPTVGGIAGSTCIDTALAIDTDYDAGIDADDHILMVADEPFQIRDHTFTRVFDYTANATAGELTFVNADSTITGTATMAASTVAVYTIDLAGAQTNDPGDTITFNNGGVSGVYTEAAAGPGITAAAIATAMIGAGTIDIDGITYDVTAGGNATTVVLTAQTAVAEADNMVVTVVDDAAEGGIAQPGGTPYIISNPGFTAPTALDIAIDIDWQLIGLVGGNNLDVVDEKLIFKMKEAGSNEFKVLETGTVDNLTPSTTNDPIAKGAISDVFTPNSIIKGALKNTTTITLGDNVDPIATDTVSVTVVNTLSQSFVLDNYVLDATDEADANVFYPKLEAWINDELSDKGLDTTVSIAKANATFDDFDATVTFTGTDVINVTAFTFLAGDVTDTAAADTNVLGTPTITNGDITTDLKYNHVLAPNYVLDGPLYDMKAAGFTAKAMVTGTMNLTTDLMKWDSIDLTRKPSEWFLSQDYNLFTVDNAAGYWTYLETAADNPLTFDSGAFTANHSHHFDQDGTTYNQVAGGIYVNVYGIDYDFDGEESARVVAIVGGSQVELSRQSGDTYTGQISSRELKEMVEGKEYDIQVVVADGIGNRIPATSTEVSVDFKKPAVPTVTITRGTMEVTNDAEDGVAKYYLFSGEIPATNTVNAADTEIVGGSTNLCSTYSKENSYDLKVVAFDSDSLATSNVSDAYMLDGYIPVFSNSAVVTDTAEAGPSIATAYYDGSCAGGDLEGFPSTSNVNAFNVSTYTTRTVKVAYTPIVADSGTTRIHFVTNDDGNTASIAYALNYENKTAFIQLDSKLYSYTLPSGAAADNAEGTAINLDTSGTYLPNQNLDEE